MPAKRGFRRSRCGEGVATPATATRRVHGRALRRPSRYCFFFSSRRRHTRYIGDWSSDVCSSDLFNVCYVANYSDGSLAAGGDPQTSIRNAENNTNPIAVVAMVGLNFPPNLTSPTWINDPSVEFIVFTPPTTGDPIDDFVPNTQALLDSEGAKAVPGVCIACHG